jgi:hypothetical protein
VTIPSPIELSVREPRSGLLDEPLVLRARADRRDELIWRARYRDDDSRVWKAAAASPADLVLAWEPAKPQTGPIAALASLRPLNVDVRVEAGDGRAAGRQVTRRLLSEGVRARKWRATGLTATLYLPADAVGSAVVLDATAAPGSPAPAAALLASRGVLTLAVTDGDLDAARERLAAVPGAPADVLVEPPLVPPNVGVTDDDACARVAAWDALLERLAARPRVSA